MQECIRVRNATIRKAVQTEDRQVTKKATDWFIQPVAFFRDRQGYYHITFMVKIHRQQICQAINFSHFPTSLSLKLSGIYDNLVPIAIL